MLLYRFVYRRQFIRSNDSFIIQKVCIDGLFYTINSINGCLGKIVTKKHDEFIDQINPNGTEPAARNELISQLEVTNDHFISL
jgi:hypothetical protein